LWNVRRITSSWLYQSLNHQPQQAQNQQEDHL
jgi:hypothetical protein